MSPLKYQAASVRQRLLNMARKRGEDFQLLLIRYGLERLLYRLGKSDHGQRYVLKGAMLYPVWNLTVYRPTMDVDLLGYGESSPDYLADVFREICRIKVIDDGLRFDLKSIHAEPIRDQTGYGGVRVKLVAFLAKAAIPLQIDIGFGDPVTPRPEHIDYPTLLDFPSPRLLIYPRESVVAEKFHAMIQLGMANSRMKDFYDIWTLARMFDFQGETLSQAIDRTFNRRNTMLPDTLPLPLTEEFSKDRTKQRQWQAFVDRSSLLPENIPLEQVIEQLQRFLWPPCQALHREILFSKCWKSGGPWE